MPSESTNSPVEAPEPIPDTAAPSAAPSTLSAFEQSFDAVLSSQKSVARQLLDSLTSLLFFPGISTVNFTETAEERAKLNEIPLKYCWAAGVGTKTTVPYNSAGYLDANRREILLCLLASLSASVYSPPAAADPNAPSNTNRWLEEFVTRRRSSGRSLLASLLNVVLRYDPIGWGVPYNYTLFFDVPEQLMNISIQLLNVIVEYRSAEPAVAAPQPSVGPPAVSFFSSSNLYSTMLSEINQTEEFDLIFKGVVRLLTNTVTASKTYLPGASKQVNCHQEVLSFFWQLVQVNRKFLDYILRRDDFTDVLFPVLTLIHEGRKDPAQLGLVHLGIFTLLFFSGEREFAIALNRPVTKKVYIDLPKFTGNYADFLLLVFIKLFVDSHKHLEALWEVMLSTTANISPYVKSLALVTSMRLLKLFGSLSRKGFLLQREKNHRYVFFLLETFNNLVQYQYEGNTYLVYSIISQRAFFFKLLELAKNPASALPELAPGPDAPAPDSPAAEQPAPVPAPTNPDISIDVKFTPSMEWVRSIRLSPDFLFLLTLYFSWALGFRDCRWGQSFAF